MSNDPCDSVLVRDFNFEEENEALAIAYLDLINRESFDQNKQAIITNANVVYEGIPMSGEGNYEEFNAKRQRYYQQRRYSINLNRARTVVSQKVPPNAFNAWTDCMRNQRGFSCWVQHADRDSVRVSFNWNPPAGVLEGRVTESTLLGGLSLFPNTQPREVYPVGHVFQPGAAVSQIFTRNSPEEDFELNVVLNNGFSAGLEIPGIIETPPPQTINQIYEKLTLTTTEILHGQNGPNRGNSGTGTFNIQPPPGNYKAQSVNLILEVARGNQGTGRINNGTIQNQEYRISLYLNEISCTKGLRFVPDWNGHNSSLNRTSPPFGTHEYSFPPNALKIGDNIMRLEVMSSLGGGAYAPQASAWMRDAKLDITWDLQH